MSATPNTHFPGWIDRDPNKDKQIQINIKHLLSLNVADDFVDTYFLMHAQKTYCSAHNNCVSRFL